MVAIWWHRRETRRKTEKTNRDLQPRKELVYSTPLSPHSWLTKYGFVALCEIIDGSREPTQGHGKAWESTEHKGSIGTWYENTNKHVWPDLEIWETNGSQGYGGSYRSNIRVDCAAYADFKRQRGNRQD